MRKIVQIAVCAAKAGVDSELCADETIYALCSDGSVWWCDMLDHTRWNRLPEIPQDEKSTMCGSYTGVRYGERCNLPEGHDEPHRFDPSKPEAPP